MQAHKWIVALVLAQGTLQAQTLLFDDFEDGTINPSLWSVDLPFPGSGVSESGGLLTTTGRGTLATAGQFGGGYIISGTVTLNHQWENFSMCLRTDLAQYDQYWERRGIYVGFLNAYDVGLYGVPGLVMGEHTPSGASELATNSFTLAYGQPYEFTVIDTGDRVSLAIDGVERLSAATTYAAGDRIAFFSREFSDTSSSLDYLRITVVPEPSTAWLAGLGTLALAGRLILARRDRQA